MSVDYTAVLADLRAKRDAMDQLIAALENVSRLNGSAPPVGFIRVVRTKAEKRVGTNSVPTGKSGRNGKHDAAVLKALSFHASTLTEIAGTMCRDKRDVGKMATRLHSVLKRLVRDGQITKTGAEYALK